MGKEKQEEKCLLLKNPIHLHFPNLKLLLQYTTSTLIVCTLDHTHKQTNLKQTNTHTHTQTHTHTHTHTQIHKLKTQLIELTKLFNKLTN